MTQRVEVDLVDGRVEVVGVSAVGPRGSQGPPGAGDPFVHNQDVPSETWTIVHNMGYYPSVTIVDSADNVVLAHLRYVDLNTVVASPDGGFAGRAFLK